MSRAKRLQPVQQVMDAAERRSAEQLAATESKLTACEHKLAELEKYRGDYRRAYEARVSSGMSSQSVRDYQTFLARLSEAIRLQTQAVVSARAERDSERERWQDAAVRAKAVEHVRTTWQGEEQRSAERREQRDSDERA